MRALIATPAPPGARVGNRVTALRWAKRLRELGWHVRVDTAWTGEPCDVLVALHARKSHASLARHAREQPHVPRVLALTGTDVYGDIHDDASARESLVLADRLVALQPLAARQLPEAVRGKTRVIRQSAPLFPRQAGRGELVCVLATLRDVKDPLLAAHALARIPESSPIRIVHLGGAIDDAWRERGEAMQRELHGRWTWRGARPRGEALATLASSRLLVLTSRSEGGANVVTEAIAAGVPVLSTRVDGSIGILGEDYPGFFEVGDAAGLADLLLRCDDPAFLDDLRRRIVALRPLVDPATERAAWRELLAELGLARS